ncbi:cysteine desulfurase [Arhodomonas aquaeolei]|uniref:aminotransferase class V-fold PLP-dependent enzyme n=1 Tax=Arhodomonas aquaeolei TaxID=2369 RepID=UPI000368A011|nr:cysteine desulfurase [Arhodomonas aquaeolei]MCS4502639.1 cysteine desulfurase [Arhodomonas aquaeolei]
MSTVEPVTEHQAPVSAHREDFPILARPMNGRPLAFLDSAASAQKPACVIDAEARCYREYYANIHRGVYQLSQRSTDAYEGARKRVAELLNAPDHREVAFVRGTTEAINLVAHSFVRPQLQPGDEILITGMEHHSNIVPWQLICEETGAKLVVSPVTDTGEVDLEDFRGRLGPRTRFASIAHVSNALGTINPVAEMIAAAREADVPTLVDGAQGVPHMAVDVQALGCDFYCFSGHKLYGPSGVGALWGRFELLRGMRPYQGGGEMIRYVTFEKSDFAPPPQRFEAGTPNIAGAIALGEAVDYVRGIGLERIGAHEQALLAYATERLEAIEGLRIIGNATHKAGVISFVLDGVHPHDIGTILDQEGVAVRAGHHCAQPVMDRFGVPATVRASFGLYNSREDVDALVNALHRVKEFFG